MLAGAGFDPFFREVHPRLVLFLMKIGAGEADAHDAVQEAMIDLLRAVSTGTEVRNPRAYVYQAAKRGFIRRAQAARREEPLDDSTPDPVAADPDKALLEEERLRVLRLLRRLPTAQREVVALYYDGLAISEMAEVIGKPEATVRSQLRHGRNRLKEVIQSESTRTSGSGP